MSDSTIDQQSALIKGEFDLGYYLEEYPDITFTDQQSCLNHFCGVGWREGRNPNAFFDTASYLIENGDVADRAVNPFYHFLRYGRREGRKNVTAVTPSVRTRILFGYAVVDWVARLEPHVDINFYRALVGVAASDELGLVAHFAYLGWRLGYSPNRSIDVRSWISHNSSLARFLVNPLIVQIERASGRFDATEVQPVRTSPVNTQTQAVVAINVGVMAASTEISVVAVTTAISDGDADHLAVADAIRSEFSAPFYLSKYPDVVAAGVDPLLHFVQAGWREGRSPNREFDTAYYTRINIDVTTAGINPFLHYITEGRREGRQPRRPGGYKRTIIDEARRPEDRTSDYVIATDEPKIDVSSLSELIEKLDTQGSGLTISLSHDCYIRSVGGTQIFVADEQAKFAAKGISYLHLSPIRAMLALAPLGEDIQVRLVADGIFAGTCLLSELAAALTEAGVSSASRFLVVHSLFGFNELAIELLRETLVPTETFFWLHDYASLCVGFNLLRNNVEFCHAPPPTSLVCRICIYGASRRQHLARMHEIFAATSFTVLAPSQVALDIWRKNTLLPYRSSRAHPHWTLKTRVAKRTMPEPPYSLAFVGFPLESKGWYQFLALIDALRDSGLVSFMHFAQMGTSTSRDVTFVPIAVTENDRSATISALRKARPAFMLMLSTWPETFSFVAHEGVVAGVPILCMEDSGNVAALVRKTGTGVVFSEIGELVEFFRTSAAFDFLESWATKSVGYSSVSSGTTASAIGHSQPALLMVAEATSA